MEKCLFSTQCLEGTQSIKILLIIILYKLTNGSQWDSEEEKGSI